MANYNKILLMGNLTRDPELSYLPNNTPVCKIGLASNRSYRRQDGEQVEETLFVDCTAFGRTAELINQYCSKGRPLFIEGRLKLDRWQDKDGQNRSKHQVIIQNFQFIDSRGGGGSEEGGSGGGYRSQPARSAPVAGPGGGGPGPSSASGGGGGGPEGGGEIDEDDIPF